MYIKRRSGGMEAALIFKTIVTVEQDKPSLTNRKGIVIASILSCCWRLVSFLVYVYPIFMLMSFCMHRKYVYENEM